MLTGFIEIAPVGQLAANFVSFTFSVLISGRPLNGPGN